MSSAAHKDADFIVASETILEEESEEYQRGFHRCEEDPGLD